MTRPAHTNPRPDDHVRHSHTPQVVFLLRVQLNTSVAFPTDGFHNAGKNISSARSDLEQTTRSRFEDELQIQLTVLSSVRAGVRSCQCYRIVPLRNPRKSTERAFGSTNKCSVLRLQGSRGCSGRQRPRRTSRRPLDVVKERLNSILPASVTGPAMPSQPSFLKFSSGIRCAT